MTTRQDADLNIAPMGPILRDDGRFIFRPFKTATTYRNLRDTGVGVFHITDDALLIARGAIGKISPDTVSTRPAEHVDGAILADACRYHELEIESLDDSDERTRIVMRPVGQGTLRDFLGFSRAKHAVLEAAILATRLHLTGATPALLKFAEYQTIIDKTGGDAEHEAIALLFDYVKNFEK